MWTFDPIKAKGKDTMHKANGVAEGLFYCKCIFENKKYTLKY